MFAFAPWIHPEPVAKAADKLQEYWIGRVLPGDVKQDFYRQALVERSDFQGDNLTPDPEMYGRANFLRELFCGRQASTFAHDGYQDFENIDAWKIMYKAKLPYISKLKSLFALDCTVTEPAEIEFDMSFLVLGNQVKNAFRFRHTLEDSNAFDRRRRETVWSVSQQEAHVDCYLSTPVIVVKFVTRAAAQARYLILTNWFNKIGSWNAGWWCTCSRITITSGSGWSRRVSTIADFVISILYSWPFSWLHAVYNDFRIYLLPPALGRIIWNFPYGAADFLGGLNNIEDLRSLMWIHNQLDWTKFHRWTSLQNPGMHYSTYLDVKECGRYLGFDPLGSLFISTEKMRQDAKYDYGRCFPIDYTTGV